MPLWSRIFLNRIPAAVTSLVIADLLGLSDELQGCRDGHCLACGHYTCTGKYVRNAETKVLSFYKVSVLRLKPFICIAA